MKWSGEGIRVFLVPTSSILFLTPSLSLVICRRALYFFLLRKEIRIRFVSTQREGGDDDVADETHQLIRTEVDPITPPKEGIVRIPSFLPAAGFVQVKIFIGPTLIPSVGRRGGSFGEALEGLFTLMFIQADQNRFLLRYVLMMFMYGRWM